MGYRYCDKPFDPEDHLPVYVVRNGAILRMSFACYYLNAHDSKRHDHEGWPNPDNPDHICQITSNMKFFAYPDRTANLDEINLTEEGYNVVSVVFDDGTAYDADTTATIDSVDPNIIHVTHATNVPLSSFVNNKPIDRKFTLFVRNQTNTDAVCRGIIRVLPGPPLPN